MNDSARHDVFPGNGKPRYRVVGIDDCQISLFGLTRLIDEQRDLQMVATASNLECAESLLHAPAPDLIILEIALAGCRGLDLIHQFCHQWNGATRILIYSRLSERMIADRARRAGAHGFAAKTQPVQELITAVRAILRGQTVFPPHGSIDEVESSEHPQEIRTLLAESLTNREFEVFNMIGNGLTVRQIAHQSGLAMKTVETHRDRIKAKLKLHNSVELLRLAVICSLMQEPPNGNGA